MGSGGQGSAAWRGGVSIKASGLQGPAQRPTVLAGMAALRLLLLCLAGLVFVAEAGPAVSARVPFVHFPCSLDEEATASSFTISCGSWDQGAGIYF